MTNRETMQQALKCIERCNKHGWILADFEDEVYAAITALKAALEQPEPEAHSYCYVQRGTSVDVLTFDDMPQDAIAGTIYPLYAAPPVAEPEQEPTPWRDMVVVSLVREGINKHKARELADHFAAQPESCQTCVEIHSLLDADESMIIRNARDGYPERRTPRELTLLERVKSLCTYAADWKRWCIEAQTPPAAQPAQEPVAVKHMMEWVDYLKRKSDYGQHMQIPSGMSAGACWELAIELEQFIDTATPQRTWVGLTDAEKKTLATAAGCTEDDDGHIVTEIFRLAEIKLKDRNG